MTSTESNLRSLFLNSTRNLNRRSKLARDQYRPERALQVERNLKTGVWTLSPNVKRYGFVEILENGEKIGLVKCAYCNVTCSRNSFKKVKSHFFDEHQQHVGTLPGHNVTSASAAASPSPMEETALDECGEDSTLLRALAGDLKSEPGLGNGFSNDALEVLLARLANGLPLPQALDFGVPSTDAANGVDADDDAESLPTSSRNSLPDHDTPAQVPFVIGATANVSAVEKKDADMAPMTKLSTKLSDSRSASPHTPSTLSANDGESLGQMVNSTYRTISTLNRRLGTEFKCSIMSMMAEFELRSLDAERK